MRALGLLPAVAFLLSALALYASRIRRAEPTISIREILMETTAFLGGWVVIGTEGFSALNLLRFWPIFIWWIIPCIVAGTYLAKYGHTLFQRRIGVRRFDAVEWAVFIPFAIVLAFSLLSAIFAPPNNYDSLAYHLPREIMWMQNGNVGHFPANNVRQLIMFPYAEFVQVHLFILSNSDRLLNMVQWCSLLLMFIAVSRITERLGGNRALQLLACLLLLVCPVVFMESSNTKNDIVVGAWITIAAWWTIQLLDGAPWTSYKAVALGCALGCAALTKGTGPLFALPIAIVLCIEALRRRKMQAIAALAITGFLSLSFCVPEFYRNYAAFGKINGSEDLFQVYNLIHGPSVVASNMIRNFVWYAAVPSEAFNDKLLHMVYWIHNHILHLNVNDERTTTPFSFYNHLPFLPQDEDRAGSPLHVYLFLLLPFAMFFSRRRMNIRYSLLLIAIATFGFVAFNYSVKWQEWHVRYFIPLTGLLCPVIVMAFSSWRPRIVAPILAFLFALTTIPTVQGSPRSVFKPADILHKDTLTNRVTYVGHTTDLEALADLCAARKAKVVGLALSTNTPDYLYEYVIRRRMQTPPRFEYVMPFIRLPGALPRHKADIIVAMPDVTTLYDTETKTDYRLYSQSSMFNVLIPGAATNTSDYPAFFGWTKHDGITDLQGPFPQWDLPIIRWGLFPSTTFTINAPTAETFRLNLVMRRNDEPTQKMTIKLNGQSIAQCAFDASFVFVHRNIPLPLHAGDNQLEFVYANKDTGFPEGRAVMFEILQMLPPAPTTTTSAPAGK